MAARAHTRCSQPEDEDGGREDAGKPAGRGAVGLHRPMMGGFPAARKADHPAHRVAVSAAILTAMAATDRRFGAQSMTAPLLEVLVKRPGAAFAKAFDDPAHGFLHPVDLDVARLEHDAFVDILAGLGPRVHLLDTELASPDLVYTFDPLLVTDQGAIPLRPGKPNRAMEPAALEAWTLAAGIPTVGRIEAPGTVEGGDTFWLRPDLLCIGRTLRTDEEGARQLAELVGGDVRLFDLPYWRGPAELIHLLSVVSPVADDLAVVYPPLLPVALWRLLGELGIRLVEVPDEEFPTLGCNVLAVAARGRHPCRRESADRGRPGRRRVRGPHLSRDRDRGQRLGRPDLHDPADPAGGLAFRVGRAAGSASSANRQNALASRIWAGVRARTRNRSGEATTTPMQRAREVATLSRFRLYRKSMPRGASSGDEVVIE